MVTLLIRLVSFFGAKLMRKVLNWRIHFQQTRIQIEEINRFANLLIWTLLVELMYATNKLAHGPQFHILCRFESIISLSNQNIFLKDIPQMGGEESSDYIRQITIKWEGQNIFIFIVDGHNFNRKIILRHASKMYTVAELSFLVCRHVHIL